MNQITTGKNMAHKSSSLLHRVLRWRRWHLRKAGQLLYRLHLHHSGGGISNSRRSVGTISLVTSVHAAAAANVPNYRGYNYDERNAAANDNCYDCSLRQSAGTAGVVRSRRC